MIFNMTLIHIAFIIVYELHILRMLVINTPAIKISDSDDIDLNLDVT